MNIPRVDAREGVNDAIVALADFGAVIIGNLDAVERMDRVVEELRPWWRTAPTGLDVFRGDRTRRVGGLIAHSSTFRELVVDSICLELANVFLRPHCQRIQLSYTQLILLGAGESVQALHRDDEVWPWPRAANFEWSFVCMWAATDFTAANGATRVVPGSHRWERDRVAREEEVEVAQMTKGELLLHLGSTLHGGGANTTVDTTRIGISFNYTLGWLRQIENQYLVAPPAIARDFPRVLQDLLGYARHGRIVGESDLEDPRVALLGRDEEEVRKSDEEVQAQSDRSTLSGYIDSKAG